MARILVDLPDEQIAALANLLEYARKPRAALIREAIAEYLVRHTPAPQGRSKVFGLWKARAVDGVAYQEAMREEW